MQVAVGDQGEAVRGHDEGPGILTVGQFRDFTFGNAARFYGGGQPGFFAGTTVEAAVSAL